MQFAVASSSLIPRRLPKKVITFGTCIAFALGMRRSKFRTMLSWLALTLRPSGIEPPPALPIEQMSP